MGMQIQTRGLSLTASLRETVNDSLFNVLEDYDFIKTLGVKLEDLHNTNHGVIDKRCQVVIVVENEPAMIVRSTQADMYVAIRHCASKVKRMLRRYVNDRARKLAA